jgi:hypothetical protein
LAKELPYLPSYKNVAKLFQKIDAAKKPEALTTRVLSETFGISGSGDRPLITLMKTLGFLDPSGKPTAQYDFLKNPTEAPFAIASGVRKAYAPDGDRRGQTRTGSDSSTNFTPQTFIRIRFGRHDAGSGSALRRCE